MLDSSQIGGVELNNMAMPSQVELAYQDFKEKKQKLTEKKQRELESQYGEVNQDLPEEIKENLRAQQEPL